MTGQFTLASVEEDPLEQFPITYRRVSDGAQGVGPVQQCHLVYMNMYMFIYSTCLFIHFKIWPAQLSCLSGSVGSVCLVRRTLRAQIPPEAALLFLLRKE